ncbi:MAG: type II toxin-antitoxin system VapC family toxin [Methylobacter sp.]|nr:type II toxin-antitoxin system VapC family toxin [Methylobacter sp.]
MTKNQVVLDACVFCKLFLQEPDREQAIALVKALGDGHYSIVVPHLFFYEVMAVAAYAKFDLAKVTGLLDIYQKAHLQLIKPDIETLKTAAAMTGSGHPKSGYPSFYDTLYHALALSLNCPFITADKKHYEKTKHLGAIVLLKEWESILKTDH